MIPELGMEIFKNSTFRKIVVYDTFTVNTVDDIKTAINRMVNGDPDKSYSHCLIDALKIRYLNITHKVLEYIYENIICNADNIITIDSIIKYYSDIVQVAQVISGVDYHITYLDNDNKTHRDLSRYIDILSTNNSVPIAYEDDAFIIKSDRCVSLNIIKIIPLYHNDDKKPRFFVAVDHGDMRDICNALNEIKDLMHVYIKEETYDIYQQSTDMVMGLIRQFEIDGGLIEYYLDTIIFMAKNLSNGYEMRLTKNDTEENKNEE
jgi:hypothetical protein